MAEKEKKESAQRKAVALYQEEHEVVNNLAKVVADCINRLQYPEERLQYLCGVNGWHDGVCDTTREARRLLGEALAALVVWFDDLEEK